MQRRESEGLSKMTAGCARHCGKDRELHEAVNLMETTQKVHVVYAALYDDKGSD